jgi:hypothetical protein
MNLPPAQQFHYSIYLVWNTYANTLHQAMLNGTMKQEDMAPNNGGFGAIQAPSFS